MTSVYKHTFPNGKIYIGITGLDTKRRWQNGKGYKYNEQMYNDICKYGWDNITHEVLCECATREEAERIECALIKKYGSTSPDVGYNIAPYAKFSNIEHINVSTTYSNKLTHELQETIKTLHTLLAEKDNQLAAGNKLRMDLLEILARQQEITGYYQKLCLEYQLKLNNIAAKQNKSIFRTIFMTIFRRK